MRWLAIALAFVCVALIALGLGGCRFSKDGVLSAYESVVQFAGQFALTPAIQLQGVRAFGEDHYTGDYRAEYENFSGTEYLFGGTSTVGRDVQVTFLPRRGERRRHAVPHVRQAHARSAARRAGGI